MAIETDRGARPVVRSRVDRATACYYPGSHRVVLIADRGDFEAAEEALSELREHLAEVGRDLDTVPPKKVRR
ncbi:hypothetical protein SEA_ZENTENO07_76 [Mycobacterium phage Zenteno07]|nr:hypothetical protein SEA_ZENTENO07_76 [Mycobacterium phage Zenteno07]